MLLAFLEPFCYLVFFLMQDHQFKVLYCEIKRMNHPFQTFSAKKVGGSLTSVSGICIITTTGLNTNAGKFL